MSCSELKNPYRRFCAAFIIVPSVSGIRPACEIVRSRGTVVYALTLPSASPVTKSAQKQHVCYGGVVSSVRAKKLTRKDRISTSSMHSPVWRWRAAVNTCFAICGRVRTGVHTVDETISLSVLKITRSQGHSKYTPVEQRRSLWVRCVADRGENEAWTKPKPIDIPQSQRELACGLPQWQEPRPGAQNRWGWFKSAMRARREFKKPQKERNLGS